MPEITIETECHFCNQSSTHTVEVPLDQLDLDFECGAALDNGGTCSRTVDSPDDTCWDH